MITELYNVNTAFDASYSQGENRMKARQLVSKMIRRISRVVVIVAALLSTTNPVSNAGALDPASASGSDVRLQPKGEIIMILSAQSAEGNLSHRTPIITRHHRISVSSAVFTQLDFYANIETI